MIPIERPPAMVRLTTMQDSVQHPHNAPPARPEGHPAPRHAQARGKVAGAPRQAFYETHRLCVLALHALDREEQHPCAQIFGNGQKRPVLAFHAHPAPVGLGIDTLHLYAAVCVCLG